MYLKTLLISFLMILAGNVLAGGGFESYIEELRQQAFKKELIAKNYFAQRKIIRSKDRGALTSDWLEGYYTFNYGSFINEFMGSFGALKMLNEETIKPKKGYKVKTSGQEDILTIPIHGVMAQKDINGNENSIKGGEIQLLSTCQGMLRAEFNPDEISKLQYLQLKIKSSKKTIKTEYQQEYFDPNGRINFWQKIASPSYDDGKLKFNQDAWVFLNTIEQDHTMSYHINKKGNGIYIFVINGSFKVNGETLDTKDGMAIWALDELYIQSLSDQSEVLLLEVPVTTVSSSN